MNDTPTVHASAILIGAKAALIRGPAGAGKSRLVLALIAAANRGALRFARLVADDRVFLDVQGGRLLVRPPSELAGLLEVRGLGIRRLPYEPLAAVGLVVDLAETGGRLPDAGAQKTTLSGVILPRLTVAPGHDPLPILLGYLNTIDSGI